MRILVSVASRHGGTSDMGDTIAETLHAAGHEVTQLIPDDVEHVEQYDAAVLGSAVYVNRVALGMRDLVDRQGGQLRDLPVWLFWSGPVGDSSSSGPATPDDVTTLARTIEARDVRMFPGRLERSELNISERALVALVKAEAGDFRDFEDVRQWAQGIASKLGALAQ